MKLSRLIPLLAALALAAPAAAAPVVSNVRAAQRPGTHLVDIYYDAADAAGLPLTVTVLVSADGGTTWSVPAVTLTGAAGPGVAAGLNRQIVWDAGVDWAGQFTSQCRVRVIADDGSAPPAPTGMALIPAGSFTMGNCMDPSEGGSDELPLHTVYVSAFYMDKYDVTKALWDQVYQWAINHGYSFDNAGSGKAANHPVQAVDWYDAVKWCNARSEQEGRVPAYYTSAAQTTVYRTGQVDVQSDWVRWNAGYRLPTEAEWEKAARGGASGHRFPWSDTDTISHSRANYYSDSSYSYDVSPTRGFHPTFNDGVYPYTSPVAYFAPNGYGFYDMAGNVCQWCWDCYGSYSSGSQTDPRGPASGSSRVIRGGSWTSFAMSCRSAFRFDFFPTRRFSDIGFRSVLPPGQP